MLRPLACVLVVLASVVVAAYVRQGSGVPVLRGEPVSAPATDMLGEDAWESGDDANVPEAAGPEEGPAAQGDAAPVGDQAALPNADEVMAQVEGALGSEVASLLGEGVTKVTSDLPLEEKATQALTTYQERGDCVLASAGYLDLSGRMWSCVVQGPGWVEVVLVSEGEAGDGSVTWTVRMDAEAWEEELLAGTS